MREDDQEMSEFGDDVAEVHTAECSSFQVGPPNFFLFKEIVYMLKIKEFVQRS